MPCFPEICPDWNIWKFRSNLELQEEVLQMLLENLEEGILENGRDDSSQCFYLKELIESYRTKREKETKIIDSKEDDTPGTPILEMCIPLQNKNISGNMKDVEDFFGRHACTCYKPKNYKKNNVSIHFWNNGMACMAVGRKLPSSRIYGLL